MNAEIAIIVKIFEYSMTTGVDARGLYASRYERSSQIAKPEESQVTGDESLL